MSEQAKTYKLEGSFEELNQRRAEVIEEIMRLRHEQARLKTAAVAAAIKMGRPELITAVVDCW